MVLTKEHLDRGELPELIRMRGHHVGVFIEEAYTPAEMLRKLDQQMNGSASEVVYDSDTTEFVIALFKALRARPDQLIQVLADGIPDDVCDNCSSFRDGQCVAETLLGWRSEGNADEENRDIYDLDVGASYTVAELLDS